MNSLITGIPFGKDKTPEQIQEDTDMAKKVQCPVCKKRSKAKLWKSVGDSYKCPNKECGAICEDDKSEMK